MAQQQLGLTFHVPVAVTAETAAAAHPATQAAWLPHQWRRTARSTSVSNGWWVQCDFGPAGLASLDGVFLNHTNCAAVMLSKSTDGVAWTNLYATNQTIPLDDRCAPPARRKGWFPATGWVAPFAGARYLRVRLYTADVGATYMELGAVSFPILESMVRNWGAPFRWRTIEPVTRVTYAGNGGSEVNVEAPARVGFSLQGGPWRADALPQLQRLRALGQDAPFFLYENLGDPARAYLLKRTADVEVAQRAVVFDAGFEFEECI
jgi:hypothetical protein